MERVLVGVRINNADTNEVWKPRLDHGNFFEALEHLFLSFLISLRTGEVGLKGTALVCIAPAMRLPLPCGVNWHLLSTKAI
jgi:hypothetical protein